MSIMQEMKERILFCDGGMGSLLQAAGLKAGELPGTWNICRPDVVRQIHKAYLEAGADIITANTFGADRLKYHEKTAYQLEPVIAAAMKNAREAVAQSGKKAWVALDLGPTGRLLKPLGDLDFEDAVSLYREVVEIGVREGADLILIETMNDSYEAKAAVLAAKEACSLPVFATVTFDERGKLLTGATPAAVVALLEGLGVDVLGINCGLGPAQMKDILDEILKVSSTPVMVNPNAGLPRSEQGQTVYDIDAEQFAAIMEELAAMGARIVGGCCGTTPEHIRNVVKRCAHLSPVPVTAKNRTVVSSFAQAVEIGKSPVIIGERINPTGKSRLKQALREHNLEYILREGVAQQEWGAHVLDVNVGLPEINEAAMLEEVVKELQSIIDLPLQLDTADPVAMERAMRIYNGKPLINSVNGKEESMRTVFPLVKKYGGVVVALCLDETGISETASGRIQVAKKIYKRAEEYGIGPEQILIDALCLTVSSDSKGAMTTLETLERVRDELGGKTILGVSNISFGLPKRELINGTFFTMAMEKGLNAAIINPGSEVMMSAYYSFRTLMELDPQCRDYIGVYGGQQAVAAGNGGNGDDISLSVSIEKGLREQAARAASARLKDCPPLKMIDQEMIPALDRVGKAFEKGTLFLPQLLMSAEAAKAAFEVIRACMEETGVRQEYKGTVLLATVKGDIHDIGKNIVKVLLENYGYQVLDLGKDVPPEQIAETAKTRQIKLVGLSALMTTTVPSMEETIRRLRAQAPWARVMVGGAVLTQDYADSMGADRYCRDAMASVNYAEEVFGAAKS